MPDSTADDQERRMALEIIGWEYQRLSDWVKGDQRLVITIASILGAVAGVGITAALQKRGDTLVFATVVNILLPLLLFALTSSGTYLMFWERRRRQYLREELETRVNRLFQPEEVLGWEQWEVSNRSFAWRRNTALVSILLSALAAWTVVLFFGMTWAIDNQYWPISWCQWPRIAFLFAPWLFFLASLTSVGLVSLRDLWPGRN